MITVAIADLVFGVLHEPVGGFSGLGVVLVPPFGWDEACSYRPRRAWADRLAAEGHRALRIDLPGTGDSGASPRDPDRLEAWTLAVDDAARWLRSEAGCSEVAVIGLGLGGMLGHRAVERVRRSMPWSRGRRRRAEGARARAAGLRAP